MKNMRLKIQLIIIFFLAPLFFCPTVNCQTALANKKSISKKKQPAKLDVFLLIGQSNMAGRAEIEPQDKDSLKNVFLFTGISGKEWEKAANPLNKYSTVRKSLSMQKLGPGYTFARQMAKALKGKQIGLVVNAKGGTSISEWKPGATLYNEAVKRAKMAMRYGTLKGIIWHQGESDVAKTDTYLKDIAELIQSLRTDLGNPDLPFVAGQLSEDNTERHAFNEMIIQLPSRVSHTGVITTEGTKTMEGTHFNSASQRLIGERYAKEMLKLLK
ncbi:MAG: sialate O-acetylesterase [Bacteroidota bacterium]|nr:sialate O-acetylesterase [Bacteroidota bacterium]